MASDFPTYCGDRSLQATGDQIYFRWCCIDLSNAPDLSGVEKWLSDRSGPIRVGARFISEAEAGVGFRRTRESIEVIPSDEPNLGIGNRSARNRIWDRL
jgi:hypothetical protein